MTDRNDRDGDESDVEEIHRLLSRYQQAHKEQDWDAVRACHDESYLRWFGCKSKDPMDWVPHLFLMQSEMQEWGETRMPEGANYEQEQEILKTEVRGNMAISVVRESGRWRSDSGQVYVRWDDTHNVWFTGRIKGEWKIIAAFFPEVTPRT